MAGNMTKNGKLRWLYNQVARSRRECDREREVKVVVQPGGSFSQGIRQRTGS